MSKKHKRHTVGVHRDRQHAKHVKRMAKLQRKWDKKKGTDSAIVGEFLKLITQTPEKGQDSR